jgi:hypothetical protein
MTTLLTLPMLTVIAAFVAKAIVIIGLIGGLIF